MAIVVGHPRTLTSLQCSLVSSSPLNSKNDVCVLRPCCRQTAASASPSVPLIRGSLGHGKAPLARETSTKESTWSWKSRNHVRRRSRTIAIGAVASLASSWSSSKSPYETLEVSLDASEEDIKSGYRRMVKKYHPDVYDGSEDEEGEKIDSKFIAIQAAYEILLDPDERQKYDKENLANPLQANREWLAWVAKKRRAWEQRGDMAVNTWQEQQAREMSVRARQRSRLKMDPEEERRNIAKERRASMANTETTLKRHNLVMKKRELMRRKANENSTKSLVQQMLEAEGFELEDP